VAYEVRYLALFWGVTLNFIIIRCTRTQNLARAGFKDNHAAIVAMYLVRHNFRLTRRISKLYIQRT